MLAVRLFVEATEENPEAQGMSGLQESLLERTDMNDPLQEIRDCNEHAQNLINYRAVKRMNELDKPKTFRGRGRRKAAKGLPIGRTLSREIHRG